MGNKLPETLMKNGWWLLAAVFFIFTTARAGVVINEFCYDPLPNIPGDKGAEWIELYNSDTMAQDLSGWELAPDRSIHYFVPSGFVLPAKGFVLIHLRRMGVNTATDLYEDTTGIDANMGETSGYIALFTNSKNKAKTLVDYVAYGADGQTFESMADTAGIWVKGTYIDTATCAWSLGLASDGVDSNRVADWKEFLKPTPGYTNDPQEYDVALSVPFTTPLEVPVGSTFTASVLVKNQGTKTARNVSLKFFRDANGDSVCQAGEMIMHQELWDSLPADRVCSFTHSALAEGAYRLSVLAASDSETVLINNCQVLSYLAGSPLVINEIMYDPSGGQPEWVEVYNRSGSPIDVCNWTIEDATFSPKNVSTAHQNILPGEYLLLAPDTSYFTGDCPKLKVSGWPSLNGDGDIICLRDLRGAAIDRVPYSSSWGGGDGKSLEKINPFLLSQEASGWGGCVTSVGSTPGARNSIYIEKLGSSANLNISPNPFSPNGDGFEDHVLIGLDFAWSRAVVNIKIFDRLGRLVKNLAEQQSFGASGTVVWDGRDGGGQICPMGAYIVLLEARDANGSGSVKKKQTVALAKKL
ncbi:lamin tail domain-containing protein [candidate division TA06 bacterium]|nr:lamin tail domain-containing protein [candidate division TA06 bacterium]